MARSEMTRRRQPRRGAEQVAAELCAEIEQALQRAEPDVISDAGLKAAMAAVVRLYAAKVEAAGDELLPFEKGALTATETVVAASAMIRAADLNLFDVAMWFGRPVRGL
jgi:hypothetical protein